jgi:hypothetical protein
MNLEKKNKYKDVILVLMTYALLAACLCMFNMHLSIKSLKTNYQALQKQLFTMEDSRYAEQVQDNSE